MFKFDSPIFNALTRIIDIITLNILWILCSLPIITIGASTTALYYSILKIIRNKDSGIISMFFRSFRQNLKQGCCMIIFFGVIGIFLCVDIQACSYIEGIGRNVILTVLVIICVMVGMVYSYVFPLLAQFENSIRATLKNAFLMSFAYFFKTIVIFVLNVIPMVLFVAFPMIFIMTVPIWLIFGIALLALINAKIFAKIFDQYIETND